MDSGDNVWEKLGSISNKQDEPHKHSLSDTLRVLKINVTAQECSHCVHSHSSHGKDNSVHWETHQRLHCNCVHFASCSSCAKQTQRYCCNRQVPFSLSLPDVFPYNLNKIQLRVHKITTGRRKTAHTSPERSGFKRECTLARKKSFQEAAKTLPPQEPEPPFSNGSEYGAKSFPRPKSAKSTNNQATINNPSEGYKAAQLPSPSHWCEVHSPGRKHSKSPKVKGRRGDRENKEFLMRGK